MPMTRDDVAAWLATHPGNGWFMVPDQYGIPRPILGIEDNGTGTALVEVDWYTPTPPLGPEPAEKTGAT
jgi:hypothetical protein